LPDDDIPAMYERMLSLTTEFFYTIDVTPDGKLAGGNIFGGVERVTGFTKEELNLQGGPEGVIYPVDFAKFKALLKSARDGEETTVEYRIIAKDGKFRLLQDHARPEKDSQGNIVRIIGVVKEISEVKQDERTQSRSEDYYKMLFEEAGDAISIVDPDTEIVLDVNRRACEMYGISREEFIGLSFVTLTKQKVRGKTKIGEFLKTGISPLHQTVHYTKDGHELHLEIRGSIVEVDGKKALMSIHRDISDRIPDGE